MRSGAAVDVAGREGLRAKTRCGGVALSYPGNKMTPVLYKHGKQTKQYQNIMVSTLRITVSSGQL